MNKNILAILFSTGLILASAPASAQSEHEGHHPAGSADSAKTQKEEPAAASDAAASDKGQMPGGMGMMGNCKMMEQMHGAKTGDMKPKGDTGPSSQAYNSVMMKMHEDMNITYSGDADVDFVKGMIPHHKAAVDMAKTVLAFGKDAEVKKVAEEVIKAQEAEIAQMQAWLEKNGTK